MPRVPNFLSKALTPRALSWKRAPHGPFEFHIWGVRGQKGCSWIPPKRELIGRSGVCKNSGVNTEQWPTWGLVQLEENAELNTHRKRSFSRRIGSLFIRFACFSVAGVVSRADRLYGKLSLLVNVEADPATINWCFLACLQRPTMDDKDQGFFFGLIQWAHHMSIRDFQMSIFQMR